MDVAGDVDVETGKGDDTVTTRNSTIARNVAINTAEGNDWVVTSNSTIGEDFTIETGSGHDRVDYQEWVTVQKSVNLNTGSGNDVVVAQGLSAQIDAIFVGGSGTDTFDDNGVTAGVKKRIKEFEWIVLIARPVRRYTVAPAIPGVINQRRVAVVATRRDAVSDGSVSTTTTTIFLHERRKKFLALARWCQLWVKSNGCDSQSSAVTAGLDPSAV